VCVSVCVCTRVRVYLHDAFAATRAPCTPAPFKPVDDDVWGDQASLAYSVIRRAHWPKMRNKIKITIILGRTKL